jgi:mannose-6-phosphate isomerase class I
VKALDVLKLSGETRHDFSPALISDKGGNAFYDIASCEYFKVKKIVESERNVIISDGSSFKALTFVSGEGKIKSKDEEYDFKKGDSFFLSAESGEYLIEGNCEYLVTEV